MAMGLALLGASVGVAIWLNPQVLQGLTGKSAGSDPQPLAAAPAASSPASEVEPAAVAAASQASSPEQAASAAQITDLAPAAAAVTAASAPAQTASEPRLIQELPEIAQSGQSWLRKLEPDTWVIEHSRHSTVQAARKQMAADPLLANARVIPVVQPGSDMAQFLVATGPFRSMERARNYIARHGLGRSAALHETATLKTLTPAAAVTARRP